MDSSRLNSIKRLAQPHDRIDKLFSFSVAALYSGRIDTFPIHDAVVVARRDLQELRNSAATAESAILKRAGVESLVRTLLAIWIARHDLLADGDVDSAEGRTHVRRRDVSSEDWQLAQSVYGLLSVSVNWALARYRAAHCQSAVAALPRNERFSYYEGREALARHLASTLHNPDAPSPEDLIDSVRRLRALGQADDRSRAGFSVSGLPCASVPEASAVVFTVEVLPPPVHLTGTVVFERHAYHIWYSSSWTRAVDSFIDENPGLDPLLQDVDAALASFHANDSWNLKSIANDAGSAQRIRDVSWNDLTGLGIPYPTMADPDCNYCWSVGGFGASEVRPAAPNISFWGNCCYRNRPPALVCDSGDRRVIRSQDGETILRYPHVPSDLPAFKDALALPFSNYEEWLLRDLTGRRGSRLHSNVGRSAGRQAFLAAPWKDTRIIHISTHGEVSADKPECCFLRLSVDEDEPTSVHFLDVLGLGLHSVELVFLNVCLTAAGKKHPGESALSLAWAFLAAGASFVIASQWRVEDDVAFIFAREFYSRYLSTICLSVQECFAEALNSTKSNPTCGRPSQWGTFRLLTIDGEV